MNSDPAEDELAAAHREATATILDGDEARTGWRRRAVGTTRAKALDEIPRVGQLLSQFPIEPLRVLQRHIHQRQENQALWLRHAVAERYLREGGEPEVAAALLDMRVDRRRRDAPRDQYGQDRSREGRRGR